MAHFGILSRQLLAWPEVAQITIHLMTVAIFTHSKVTIDSLEKTFHAQLLNPLTPNDPYSACTAPLTSKVAFYIFIQQI